MHRRPGEDAGPERRKLVTDTSLPVRRRMTARANVVTLVIAALFVSLFSIGLVNLSQDGHQMSVVDEHIHFDTAVRATQGVIP